MFGFFKKSKPRTKIVSEVDNKPRTKESIFQTLKNKYVPVEPKRNGLHHLALREKIKSLLSGDDEMMFNVETIDIDDRLMDMISLRVNKVIPYSYEHVFGVWANGSNGLSRRDEQSVVEQKRESGYNNLYLLHCGSAIGGCFVNCELTEVNGTATLIVYPHIYLPTVDINGSVSIKLADVLMMDIATVWNGNPIESMYLGQKKYDYESYKVKDATMLWNSYYTLGTIFEINLIKQTGEKE